MKVRVLIAALIVAGPVRGAAAAGELYSQVHPGATCNPSNTFGEKYFLYEAGSLVNTSEAEYPEVFVAVCGLSDLVPKARVLELRALLRDPKQQDAWCALYDARGEEFANGWARWRGDSGYVYFAAPPYGSRGLLNATVHCLVRNRAALERIEVIWETP